MRERCWAKLAVAAWTALLTACTGATHGTGVASSPSNAATASSASPAILNPFTIVARYSAASLGLSQPANLAIGPDRNLYVTDAAQHVTVVSPDGKVVRRWGRPGKAAGEFSFTHHEAGLRGVTAPLAVGDKGLVYVVDSGNARVEVFSPSGSFIRQFGTYGTAKGQFLFPSFVAVDREGRVYVADDQSLYLTQFSSTGTVQWRIGGSSANDPDLVGHFHLATVDSHGRLVTLNDDVEKTLYIDARGHKVDAFASGGCDITVDELGDTYVNDCQEPLTSPHDTWVFDRSHRLVGELKHSGFGYSPRFGPNGEVFTLGEDGSILKLKVALLNA